MEASQLLEIALRGEDRQHQFKEDASNASALGSEMVAFANSDGGRLFIGIANDGSVRGHDTASVAPINKLISTAADQMQPSITPKTENVSVDGGVVIVVTVAEGLSKPYMDNQGAIWVKSGSDKRKVTSREEMQRMFQSAQLVHGDNVPVAGSSIADVDVEYFRLFYEKRFGGSLESQPSSLAQVLGNMRLATGGQLTVSGALLFAQDPTPFLPIFHVKAVWYPGTNIHADTYLDSANITGRLENQFDSSLAFIMRGLRQAQNGQDVNTTGSLEVPKVVLQELLANALIHRDYFISAPIRIFIFDDRVEIISPGHLPNNLTVANIRSGNSNIRNPILASFANHVLPYRGLGNGIVRALQEYPDIDFVDDREGNKFTALIRRPPLLPKTEQPR